MLIPRLEEADAGKRLMKTGAAELTRYTMYVAWAIGKYKGAEKTWRAHLPHVFFVLLIITHISVLGD